VRTEITAKEEVERWVGSPFVLLEVMATDVGKAKSFCRELFEWKLEDTPMGETTYTVTKVGEGTGGGLMKNPMPNARSMWLAYVSVDDLKAASSKAKPLGAKVMKDNVEVKDIGGLQHHHRPDRGDAWPLAGEDEGVTIRRRVGPRASSNNPAAGCTHP
jgi:predicted enzyme related to lactoylglutathione lyase